MKAQQAIKTGATHVIKASKFGSNCDIYVKNLKEHKHKGWFECETFNTGSLNPCWSYSHITAKGLIEI